MTTDEARAKLTLLNKRTQVVEGIGRVKRERELPISGPKREERVFADVISFVRELKHGFGAHA